MITLTAVLLALAAIVFTLAIRVKDLPAPAPASPTANLEERKAAIFENLRDLQFEYRVGKLSEEDYARTKLDLERELAGVLAQIDGQAVAPPPVPPGTVCPRCGAKFERPLKFCGECAAPMTVALLLCLMAVSLQAAGAVKVIHDVVLLQPADTQLSVRETIIYQNTGKETYSGPTSIYVPEEAQGTLRVSAAAPGVAPLEQTAIPAGRRGVFRLDFPIQPGQTSFDVSYTVPLAGSFSSRVIQKDAPVRLVVPAGVTLKGEGIELLGQMPQTQASIYGAKTLEYTVEIAAAAAAAPSGEDTGSGLEQILPRVYGSLYPILGLALTILALGFAMLYRKSTHERR
jgi:hypothetical protein